MSNKVIVSVIMPVFNSAKTLEEAVYSVLAQSFQQLELIIIDDCSSDISLKLIKKLMAQDARISLIQHQENHGAGVARNSGIVEAKGRFIAFLDADDIWLQNKLTDQMKIFDKEDNVGLVYSPYYRLASNGGKKLVVPPKEIQKYRLQFTNDVPCSTAIYDSNLIGKKYFPEIRFRQDWALWLIIIGQGFLAISSEKPTMIYRTFGGMTEKKIGILGKQWFFFRRYRKFGLIKSSLLFVLYSALGFVKTL